jgi:hypothetical protein
VVVKSGMVRKMKILVEAMSEGKDWRRRVLVEGGDGKSWLGGVVDVVVVIVIVSGRGGILLLLVVVILGLCMGC